jgi:NAD(P)-dependent dehydrogenase (short-subunit alcohol dehydrogenase family)
MGAIMNQLLPPKPTYTEKNVTSLTGKVFIVTGGNSGVGLALVKILYSNGGTIYIASRSASQIATAIEEVKTSSTTTHPGTVKSLVLDLNDLTTISPAVSSFLAQESRLDVLWNNAGSARAPAGAVTIQGHEAMMGINCLGHFLLTQLLVPILLSTAKFAPPASVRVVFTSSGIVDMLTTPPGGLVLSEYLPGQHDTSIERRYGSSKSGNWFLASEFDRRYRKEGLLSVCQNPGTLNTKGWDDMPWIGRMLFRPFMHEPVMGAYTEPWAGLSEEVKMGDGGRLGIPWGR